MQMQLDEKQIESFREHGYIVIPNVLTAEEIIETRQAFHETLRKNGVVIFVFLKMSQTHKHAWRSKNISLELISPALIAKCWKINRVKTKTSKCILGLISSCVWNAFRHTFSSPKKIPEPPENVWFEGS